MGAHRNPPRRHRFRDPCVPAGPAPFRRAHRTAARFSSAETDDQPDVVVAARNVEAAEAELARVELDLARGIVVAPIAGTVLDIHETPGQRPPAEGVMEMGDISQMTAEVEVYQDRIWGLRTGWIICLRTCRADRSSAWRSAAPWSAAPMSFWRTNPRLPLTGKRPPVWSIS